MDLFTEDLPGQISSRIIEDIDRSGGDVIAPQKVGKGVMSGESKTATNYGGNCALFSAMRTKVKSQAKHKVDELTPYAKVRVDANLKLPNGAAFTEYGLDTLASHTKISPKSISSLLEEGYRPEVVTILNSQLNRREEAILAREEAIREKGRKPAERGNEFLLRYRHDEKGKRVCRAVVSDRYAVLDNDDAVEFAFEALKSIYGKRVSDFVTCRPHNDGDNVVFNLFLPEQNKDGLFTGFSIKNSEVRKYKFQIDAYLFREYCTNGMIIGKKDSRSIVDVKHIGKIDLDVIRYNVKQVITAAYNDGPLAVEQFKNSREIRLSSQPENLIAYLSKKEGLTIAQGQAWWKAYQVEPAQGSLTAWDITNALTRGAWEGNFSAETQSVMNATAGRILTPGLGASLDYQSKPWMRYNAAAADVTEKEVLQYVMV